VAFTAPVPRSLTAFRQSETTAERRSHVVLSLGRCFTVHPEGGAAKPDAPDIDSRGMAHEEEALSRQVTRASHRARPPFTLTATLFGALRASLFETRTLPADFCN